jgi:streptogramin lyase
MSRNYYKIWAGSVAALLLVVVCLITPRQAMAQPPTFLSAWQVPGLPLGLAVGADGRVFVVDETAAGGAARMYSPTGASLGILGPSNLGQGYGVALSNDNSILIANYSLCSVQRYSPTGTLLASWPVGGSGSLFIAVDDADNVYVTDDEGNAIRKFSKTGSPLAQWTVQHPSVVACFNGSVYVVGMFAGIVSVYSPTGTLQRTFPTGCTWAEQLASDGYGHLYLADHGKHELKCFQDTGELLWTLGDVPGYAYVHPDFFSVAIGRDGTLYAGGFNDRHVLRFSPRFTGVTRTTFGALKALYR